MNQVATEEGKTVRPGRGFKVVGVVLSALVGLVLLLTLVGYSLPSEVQLVDTSLTLEASSAELFPYFNSRAGQQRKWTQASRRFGGNTLLPMIIADLGGPDAGVGTGLGFFPDTTKLGSIAGAVSSAARGRGVIVESEPDRKVVIEIDFGMVVTRRTIDFEAQGKDSTRVIWSETLLISNPLMRYFPLLLDSSINEGFNEVLRAAEEVAKAERSSAIELP